MARVFAAVVLAGGAARRLGGATKPALHVGSRSMLRRVLDALDQARPRIVVGPADLASLLRRDLVRSDPVRSDPVRSDLVRSDVVRSDLVRSDVVLTQESPPGGGPVAAIAAGLAKLGADPDLGRRDGQVAVVACDLPFLSSETIDTLRRAADHTVDGAELLDGAVLMDAGGRAQWLAGVWRTDRLVGRIADLGDPAGQSMRGLASGLRVALVPVEDRPGPPPWFDCDTPQELRQAQEWTRRPAQAWTRRQAKEWTRGDIG